MPTGGLISGAASGLKLQPNTPGTADTGHANVTGTIYASDFRTHLGGPGDPNHVLVGSFTMGGRTTADWGLGNTMIGEAITMGSLTGNTVIGTSASAGSGLASSAQGCVIIGNATIAGTEGYGTTTGGVVVGNASQIHAPNQVVVGAGSQAAAGSAGTVVIGGSSLSTYNGGAAYNVLIGTAQVDSGNPGVISIGYGGAMGANSVRIGVATMTDVKIGAYVLRQSTPIVGTTADTSPTISVGVGTVLYTSITAARAPILPLASSNPVGWSVLIADVSGSASAVNTITATRQGADTINAGTVDPLPIVTPYGSRTFISDGVSKWIAKN